MQGLLSQHGQELSPWLLVAAASAVVLVVLLLGAPLLRRRSGAAGAEQTAAQPATPPAVVRWAAASGEHRALERDIQNLITELSDLTRRVNAQIAQVDERAARLEQLIRAADERAAKLRATPSLNGDGAATSPLPAMETSVSSALDEVIDPKHVEIYTLCEQGLSPQQIADRLNRPSGEVELIIALRPRKHAVGSSRE